jgi:hypothetical protein
MNVILNVPLEKMFLLEHFGQEMAVFVREMLLSGAIEPCRVPVGRL